MFRFLSFLFKEKPAKFRELTVTNRVNNRKRGNFKLVFKEMPTELTFKNEGFYDKYGFLDILIQSNSKILIQGKTGNTNADLNRPWSVKKLNLA